MQLKKQIYLVKNSQLPQSEKYQAPKIALVIPAFNEEENILKVVAEVQKFRKQRPRWNIKAIIINDGSTDGTAEVLEKVAFKNKIDFISLPLNLGIGRAVQTGFLVAARWGADVTLQLDGDGQHPADQIPAIVCPILAGRADVVVGSRYLPGAGGNVSSVFRRIGTGFFSFWLKLLVGIKISDTTSGFRAFCQDAVQLLSIHYGDDYPEVEAYIPLARKKFKITEVPVSMRVRARGASSITFLRSIYYMIKVAISTLIERVRYLPVLKKKAKSSRIRIVRSKGNGL